MKLATKKFVFPLTKNIRYRHLHQSTEKNVMKFSVQLEIFFQEKWQPFIRYDTAHGFAHKDSITPDGQVNKIPMPGYMDYSECLDLAEADLLNNWQIYQEKFLKEAKHE